MPKTKGIKNNIMDCFTLNIFLVNDVLCIIGYDVFGRNYRIVFVLFYKLQSCNAKLKTL